MTELIAAFLGAMATYVFTRAQDLRTARRKRQVLLAALVNEIDATAMHLDRFSAFGGRASSADLLVTPFLDRLPDLLEYLDAAEARHCISMAQGVANVRVLIRACVGPIPPSDKSVSGTLEYRAQAAVVNLEQRMTKCALGLAGRVKDGHLWLHGRSDPHAVRAILEASAAGDSRLDPSSND